MSLLPARRSSLFFALSLASAAAAACVPHRDVPAADVPKLTSLSDLMDVQATVADKEFSKIGDHAKYTDADYVAFSDVSTRLLATSTKAKEFSKGPGFDKLADQLHDRAEKLGAAAGAKDAKGSSDALAAVKATCKECHSKFK